jgi:hypothetical protein
MFAANYEEEALRVFPLMRHHIFIIRVKQNKLLVFPSEKMKIATT